jgi:hypothetical protein
MGIALRGQQRGGHQRHRNTHARVHFARKNLSKVDVAASEKTLFGRNRPALHSTASAFIRLSGVAFSHLLAPVDLVTDLTETLDGVSPRLMAERDEWTTKRRRIEDARIVPAK